MKMPRFLTFLLYLILVRLSLCVQVGKGPWSSEVSGIVKIGQTMTMVLGIKVQNVPTYADQPQAFKGTLTQADYLSMVDPVFL